MSDEPPEPPPPPDEPAPAPVAAEPAPEPSPSPASHPVVATEPTEPTPAAPGPAPRAAVALLRRFAFLAIPAIALVELLAHLVQVSTVVTADQWLAARDAVRALAKPDDLVVMAPYWTDPLGREYFKDELLSLAREARPDSTRFPRAVEVSIRGQHLGELDGWHALSKQKVGPVTLTLLENPSYVPLKDDLVNHVAPGKIAVSVVSGSQSSECGITRGRVETGGLGFGPAIPETRVSCPGGGLLAATVMQPGDYRPHRCLFAPPLGSGRTMRVRFQDVAFGDVLHGHAGIDWDSIAHTNEPPVTLVWKLGDRTLGRIVAGNNDGWKGFELDTREQAGQRGELVAEISSGSSRNRLYCFEADTR